MIKYKTFTKIFSIIFFCFIAYNFLVWEFHNKDLLTKSENFSSGDLSRLGYTKIAHIKRKNENLLPKRHINITNYKNEKIDIITLGDSFSNGGAGGKNPFYQDYIASINNLNVLNIHEYEGKSMLETISIMLNSGYLDKIKPKYIILQSVERHSVQRFMESINFEEQIPLKELENYYENLKNIKKIKDKICFINNGNFKYPWYKFLYLFSDHAYFAQTYIRDLTHNLFSVKNGDKLLFYYADLDYIPFSSKENLVKLNDNLNILSERLAKKDIKLYFMPAVDKYNLYSDYIIDNPYPKSTFFEKLRPLEKNYYFIDTKDILSKELEKGEKDIFYPDDTHWSWKASKIIFETVLFKEG